MYNYRVAARRYCTKMHGRFVPISCVADIAQRLKTFYGRRTATDGTLGHDRANTETKNIVMDTAAAGLSSCRPAKCFLWADETYGRRRVQCWLSHRSLHLESSPTQHEPKRRNVPLGACTNLRGLLKRIGIFPPRADLQCSPIYRAPLPAPAAFPAVLDPNRGSEETVMSPGVL